MERLFSLIMAALLCGAAFACSPLEPSGKPAHPPTPTPTPAPPAQAPPHDADAKPGTGDGAADTGGTSTDTGSGTATTGTGTSTGGGDGPPPESPYNRAVAANAESIQKNLIDPYCVSCHRGEQPSGKLNLENIAIYTDGRIHGYPGKAIDPGSPPTCMIVMTIEETRANRKMPPPGNSLGIPLVEAAQLKALKDWIAELPHQDPSPDGEDGVDISLEGDAAANQSANLDGGSGFAP